MTVVGEAVVLVRPLSAGFTEKVLADTDKAMVAAGRNAGASFGKSLSSAIPGANGLQKGVVGITAAVVGAGVASIHMANQFNQNLLLLHTQAGASTAEVNNMRGAIEKLAPEVATGPAKLAEALYHIESTGIRGAAALDDLTIAAQGAKIGQADLDATTYALTSTLMTGIHGITGAKDAMAALDAIVGTGDMHMQDLNGAISTGFLSTAETFGVSLQSIGAALSYMTDRGSSAQESATRLRMSLALMAAPSNQASKMLTAIGLGGAEVTARTGAMTDALRAAHLTTTMLSDDLKKPDGLEVALSDLVTHLRDSGLSADAASALISRAFGGGRSGAAIMSLVQHLDVLKGKYNEQIKIAGNYDERWAATVNSTSFRWSQFVTLVQTDAIKVGEALIPMTNELGSGLFNALSGAPRALAPLSSGLHDVVLGLGDVLHAAEPLGRVAATIFTVQLVATWDTIGFVLRDVVAPALHLVGDGVHLLVSTTPGVILLSTVLAYRLLPVVINLAREFGAWALEKVVIGLYNVTVAAERTGETIATLDPVIAAVSVAIGAGIGIYQHYADAKKKVTEQTDALVVALQHEAAGQQNSIITALDKELNDSHVGDNIQRLGLNINDVAMAINGSSSSWDKIIGQMRDLTSSSALSGSQLKANRGDVWVLLQAMDSLSGRVKGADKAYGSLTLNQRVASHALTDAKPPVDALTAAHQALTTAETNLATASGALGSSADTYAKSLEQQFPIFDAYVAKLDLNGTTLLANIEQTTKAIVQEGTNVETLAKRGLSGDVIQQLVGKGPEYVAAAAQLTTAQLQTLQTDVAGYWSAIAHTSNAAALHDGSSAGANFVAALAAKQAAVKHAADLTFYASVQSAAASAANIAGNGGGKTGDQFADRVNAKKNTVLTSMLNALPLPVRIATLQALGIATDAGGKLPQNLAAAIAAHSPAARLAAENLRIAVQGRIDALHGKTVSVDAQDRASAALNTITGDIQKLEGYNNVLKAYHIGAADGMLVPGPGGPRQDNHLIRVSAGETIVPAHLTAKYAPYFAADGIPGFAAGGAIGDLVPLGAVATHPLVSALVTQLGQIADFTNIGGGLGNVGGGVSRWLPVVLQALALNGASASWAPRVLAQIQFESGGDPNAHQQVIDINTFNGSGGAQGLMQVLFGTFLANHIPGTSMNIFDPLANLAAGIHHAIFDDPGGLAYLGQGHGYDGGGPVRPGRTLVINNTGGDEFIENGPQHQARTQRGGTPPLEQTNHFYGVDLDEALAQAGARMMHAVNTYMR